MRPRALHLTVAIAAAFTLLIPTTASAHQVTVEDPQEAPPNLSGPKDPDAKRVTITYLPSGSAAAQIELWEPLPKNTDFLDLDFDISVGHMGLFQIGSVPPITGSKPICLNDFSMSNSLGSSYGYITIAGSQGNLEPSFYRVSSDRRTHTYYIYHSALAGKAPDCASWSLSAREYSMSGSTYFSSCNCFPVTRTLDGILYSATDTLTLTADNPACGDGTDNDGDGLTDTKDPGCFGQAAGTDEADPPKVATKYTLTAKRSGCTIETSNEALPDLEPDALFPWSTVVMEVSGTTKANRYKVTRRLPIKPSSGYVFGPKKAGRFKVRSWYPGDKWRAKSKVVTRFVTLPAKCKKR